MKNLIQGLHKELDRARELLKAYEEIPTGFFGVAIIKQAIQKAVREEVRNDYIEWVIANSYDKPYTGKTPFKEWKDKAEAKDMQTWS